MSSKYLEHQVYSSTMEAWKDREEEEINSLESQKEIGKVIERVKGIEWKGSLYNRKEIRKNTRSNRKKVHNAEVKF